MINNSVLNNKLSFFSKNFTFIYCVTSLLICYCTSSCSQVYRLDSKTTFGAQIMEYVFDKFPVEANSFLVKYRKDKKFIGVLIVNLENRKENILKIFNCETGLEAFEYGQKDKEITDFVFKKNAVVMSYKSTFWEEKAAYDLNSGKFVRRYSSLLANMN